MKVTNGNSFVSGTAAHKSMNVLNELHTTTTACGNVLRGSVEVFGKEFRVECDTEKTHIQIIAPDGAVETGEIDADGDVIAQSGECVTQDWTADDWTALTAFVGAKPSVVLPGNLEPNIATE